ncbi:hypothetical protein VPH35_052940 [Triticum aestivum]
MDAHNLFVEMPMEEKREEIKRKGKKINTRVIDRWDPCPTHHIVHLSMPRQHDMWAQLVSFTVFAMLLDYQCSALRIRRNFGGFLCPDLNLVPSCYPSPKCGGFG